MATSSIFTNISIKDPKKIELFISALESSEKAVKNRPAVKSYDISVVRDSDSIRWLMKKRCRTFCYKKPRGG